MGSGHDVCHFEGSRYMTNTQVLAFSDELMRRLRALPGTRSAALGFGAPFTEWARQQSDIIIEGQSPPPPNRPNVVESKVVSPSYFSTLGIPVLRGRAFTEGRAAARPLRLSPNAPQVANGWRSSALERHARISAGKIRSGNG